MSAREIALIAREYLVSNRHAATWAKCKCHDPHGLHAAIEAVLREDEP